VTPASRVPARHQATTASSRPEPGLRPVNTAAILAIVLVSFFMVILDNSILFTGLPHIQRSLGLTDTGLSWTSNAYTLVFGGLLLLGARSGDLLGRRRMFIWGLAIFSLASLLVGVAPTGWWMIAARALQGTGAAVVAPLSLSLLTTSFPEGRERSRAVSYYGATAGIGAAVGLLVGGALTEWVSWRAGFLINIPIGIAVIAATVRHVPETPRKTGRFDITGAILSTLGVGMIVFGVVSSAGRDWASPLTMWPVAAGVVLLALLIANEARARQPILPLRVFRSRERSGAYIGRLLFGAAMMSFFYFTSQFLQSAYHYTPFRTGMAFLPMTIASFLLAVNVPRLMRRFGSAGLMTVGFVLLLCGLGWLSQIHPDSPYLTGIALPMVVFGVGQGLTLGPLTGAGVTGATDDLAGPASGLVNTTQQLGGSIGIATLVAVTASVGGSPVEQVATAYTGGTLFTAGALAATLILIVPSALARRRATSIRPAHASQ